MGSSLNLNTMYQLTIIENYRCVFNGTFENYFAYQMVLDMFQYRYENYDMSIKEISDTTKAYCFTKEDKY